MLIVWPCVCYFDIFQIALSLIFFLCGERKAFFCGYAPAKYYKQCRCCGVYASQHSQFFKYVYKKIECNALQSVLGIEPSWDICNPSPCTLGFYSVFSHAFAYLLCYALVYVLVE